MISVYVREICDQRIRGERRPVPRCDKPGPCEAKPKTRRDVSKLFKLVFIV